MPNNINNKIQSPDRETFDEISKYLSRTGMSVNAANVMGMFHIVGFITPRTADEVAKLGAVINPS